MEDGDLTIWILVAVGKGGTNSVHFETLNVVVCGIQNGKESEKEKRRAQNVDVDRGFISGIFV